MSQIKSFEDLRKIKEDFGKRIQFREKSFDPSKVVQIKVGFGTSGIASGAKEVMTFLRD